jgi:uncharacterized protein (DUF849 family)
MPKVMLEVRCNEYAMRDGNPNVPWTPEEIANDAILCQDAGASIFHFHARDAESGAPSSDPDVYGESIRLIKQRTDLVVNPTLGATSVPDPMDRVSHIPILASDPATRPDIAPLDLVTTNIDAYLPGKGFMIEDLVYLNPVSGIKAQAAAIRAAGVRPEAVLWNVGSARLLEALLDSGHLEEPVFAEVVVSDLILACHPATVPGLDALLQFLPKQRAIQWACLVPGGNVLELIPAIVERGGHIAVGLGDQPFSELGSPRNHEVIARAARRVSATGAELASPAEARQMLGLG